MNNDVGFWLFHGKNVKKGKERFTKMDCLVDCEDLFTVNIDIVK